MKIATIVALAPPFELEAPSAPPVSQVPLGRAAKIAGGSGKARAMHGASGAARSVRGGSGAASQVSGGT